MTGLTVRALHHYEQIGLAAPAGRNRAGYRVYGANAVQRLLVISRLRPLGLPLSELRLLLNGSWPRRVLAAHVAELEAEVERGQADSARG